MAKYSFSFLLLLVLSTSLKIEARESKFFNRATHHHNEISASPQLAPAPSPETSLTPTTFDLFGQDSNDQFSPATTTTTAAATSSTSNDEFEGEELGENYEEEDTDATSTTTNNNNGYSNNYYNANNNNNDGYGLSDTRFLEKGKYYYDAESEKYNNEGYETVKGNGNNEGYYGNGNGFYDTMNGSENSDQGYYGKSENPNEFDDTMELSGRQQGYVNYP